MLPSSAAESPNLPPSIKDERPLPLSMLPCVKDSVFGYYAGLTFIDASALNSCFFTVGTVLTSGCPSSSSSSPAANPKSNPFLPFYYIFERAYYIIYLFILF